jgi:glycosyltransferase involved in cell wall biosynthesis
LAKLAELGIGIPVINTEHSAFEQPRNFPMLLTDRIAKYWLNYLYDGITILTKVDMDIIKNRFKNRYLLPNPTFLMPLGIVPEKQNVVFAAGRIDAWGYKGFDVLLKAWERVINDDKEENKHQDWKLQIAGDGKDESFKYLMGLIPDGNWQPISDSTNESETRNMGSGFSGWHSSKYSIEFLGFRKDVAQLYGTASVFVLSSRYEGFGMVLVEAMSQGCAPVACDYKGRQKEILGDCGICCKPDDVGALAASIKKMMVDDTFRKQSQGDALRRSKDFSKERIIDKWESILSSVLSKQS